MIPTLKDIDEAIILLNRMPCYDPHPEILVTHDMAIDAGDPELEGTTFQEEQRCGKCEACVIQQIIIPILAALKHGEFVDAKTIIEKDKEIAELKKRLNLIYEDNEKLRILNNEAAVKIIELKEQLSKANDGIEWLKTKFETSNETVKEIKRSIERANPNGIRKMEV